MSNTLSLLHIKRACGDQAFKRGQAYQRAGRIRSLQVEAREDGIEIVHASVAGRGRNLYQQIIELRHSEQHQLEIDGECSCPVGYDCKHVAAVLIELIEQRRSTASPGDTLSSIDTWLSDLKNAGSTPQRATSKKNSTTSSYTLVYTLEPDLSSSGPAGLQVSAHKVRMLKRGGYGKPAPFQIDQALEDYYVYDFLHPIDQQIARLLATPTAFYYARYNSEKQLKGEFGELALKKLLESGRCHWRDVEGPVLHEAAPRRIEFEWTQSNDGQQLLYNIEPPVEELLRLQDFWFIDTPQHAVGRVAHPDLSAEQLQVLLQAPVIPAQQLETVARKLLLDTPECPVEPPVALDLEKRRLSQLEPTPRLRLVYAPFRQAPGEAAPVHHARLSFRYAEIEFERLTDHPLHRVCQDNILYEVTREPEMEAHAIEQLEQLGLSRVADTGGEFSLDWTFADATATDEVLFWFELLEHDLDGLKAQGWEIDIDPSFQITFSTADSWDAEVESGGDAWFTLSLGIEVEGQHVNLLPVLVNILAESDTPQTLYQLLEEREHFLVPLDDFHWLKIGTERLQPIFETLVELYDQQPLDKEGNLTLNRLEAAQLGDLLNNPQLRWKGAEELKALNDKLRNFSGITPVTTPEGFQAQLRSYQSQGIAWLNFLQEFGFHGILADDMGLGKTVQTLAHLLREKLSGRQQHPNLVIAPTSLMGNWRREAEHFAPSLRVAVLHGPERHRLFTQLAQYDLILTTYPLLRRDRDLLQKQPFHLIVLDEAQAIKNPKSQTTQTVFELQSQNRLCLTGTPLENHLGELWSMFHFLMPGFLGPLERFNRLYRRPIEKHADDVRAEQLRKRLAPFLLRRTKEAVATELPEKNEIIRTVTLEGDQRDLYESIRMAMDKKVRDEIKRKGLARSQIMILDALLKLRQVCCDPSLVTLPQAKRVKTSAKLQLLMEVLPEMIEEGRRILLFSQFTSMLQIIRKALEKRGIDYSLLTGQTRKRDAAIARFQEGEAPVFLISLKAGGVGLNLTAADTVIHYDPWWNPAAENQATDRAHRIGQKNTVFVYKLITEQTVEDKILALQQKKQALADSIYTGERTQGTEAVTAEDLEELLKPLSGQ